MEDKFNQAQQELVDAFKDKLKKCADDVISNLYTDVVNFATTDAHINYHNFLRNEFRQSFIEEISTKHTHYSWAHEIRMELLKNHADVLRTKIISDLEDKIKSLEEHIEQMRKRY